MAKLDPATVPGAVTLNVADLRAVTAFYVDVIGLHVNERGTDRVALGTGDRTWVILQALPEGQFVQHRPGLYHIALRLPSRRALAHWLHHYVAAGTPNGQGAADHGVSEALYLADPEGNGIEIYRDRPRDDWPTAPDGGYAMGTWALNTEALVEEAPDTAWAGMPEGTVMGHVHLKVADLEAARAFYVDTLGFEVQAAMGGSALFVSAGGYHHHIGLNTWESRGAAPAPDNAYGLAAFEIVFPTEAARDAVLARLAAARAPVTTGDGSPPRVADPSGNTLILALTPETS